MLPPSLLSSLCTTATLLFLLHLAFCLLRCHLPRRRLDAEDAVLVTGCDSGFGLAIVKTLLLETGATVVAGAVTKEGLERLKKMGGEKNGNGRVVALLLDVTKDEDVKKAIEEIASSGKKLAGVVNNAGIGIYGWCEAMAMETYEKIIQINLVGTIRVTKAALPLLRKSSGRLVTMGSLAGRAPSAFGSAYTPTKAAVASFQDAVRQEVYRFGVYCSLIEPGFFATGMLHRSAELGRKDACGAESGEDPAVVAAYGSYSEKMKRTEGSVIASEKLNGGEEGVSWVTDSVLDALTNPWPRTRYLCGFDANLLGRLSFFVPDLLTDLVQTYII
mmetsp:Transcript_57168/g.121563  ORF Transcript_57168/g.121563 Transcript_57168/m.121563 type:complete len:331 (+) Transcript_57168:127-1119(+)|eukprot:CAMPEP_0206508362 /NCGR_PEP_ID=MMETSP0324_2-20121206/58275_1 /ASSEMBLY_ACC=CAM_ASM_000836 /TAXON_ID=2866 /ORGANISM="Crypthecodinium cohnii, Strain Seligo" /LENGTH=330 /DNA_ID=CAMNT_0053999187 /DNA_START=120 /DNA_END=1112 /DNA_ORIENTATION=-